MAKIRSSSRCGVVILAAGLGKRMRSTLPKVLHEVAGKPLLFHVLMRLRERVPQASIGIVVGHARELVEAYVKQETDFKGLDITFIFQPEQRGTGHAARCAMESSWGQECIKADMPILVLPGDLPLISSALIEQMTVPLKKGEALRLLTCELSDPSGYGRIVRKGKGGAVLRIVEEKDATLKEKKIREVGLSIYYFEPSFFHESLRNLSDQNAQGEYYLTDTIEFAKKRKRGIGVLLWGDSEDLRGVNDLWDLAQVCRVMNERILQSWAIRGVKLLCISTTQVEITVELAEGVVLHSGVILTGKTKIGKNSFIGSGVVLKDVESEDGVTFKTGTVAEHSRVGSRSQLGPYAHLRPGSWVGADTKIGNFVELKKSKIGDHTSIAHLSYVGDADVGNRVNIGCGFVTCNFDGRTIDGERKHRTIIEDEVFLGSDCQTVAPVRVGRGAYVASGSTITEDVPAESLAIARSRQVNKPGYAEKLRRTL